MGVHTGPSPGDSPFLKAPVDLSKMSDADIAQKYAEPIAKQSGQTADEVMSQLEYLKEMGIPLTQSEIDTLEAGEPLIPPPSDLQLTNVGPTSQASTAAEWLLPNSATAIERSSLGIESAENRFAVTMGMRFGDLMQQTTDDVQLDSQAIENSAQQQAKMDIMGAVGGGFQIGAGVASAATMAGSLNAGDDPEVAAARGSAASSITSGLGTIIEKGADAAFTTQKGVYDAADTVWKNAVQINQSSMSTATTAWQSASEMVGKFSDSSAQTIGQQYQTFGFSPH